MSKTLKELRNHLNTLMKQSPTGTWINPFRDEEYQKTMEPVPHVYCSQAVDEALKFFMSKYLGEKRRKDFLGEEWGAIL